MNWKRCSIAVQSLVMALMAALLAAACGGGTPPSSYTASAGVGEVLQVTVDTSNMTYSYVVRYSSYGASGVVPGQNSTGPLLPQNPDGTYNIGASQDGFVLGGKILPLQGRLLSGNVALRLFGSGVNVPVFGGVNPIGSLVGVSGVYNFQGFSCSVSGVPNVLGNAACTSHTGTIAITSTGTLTLCRGGDINTSPAANACVTTVTGSINAASATPGIFDFRNGVNAHVGWFFAFKAPNGQVVAVIDHDDAATPEYGHAVLSTYASAVSGAADGSYFVTNNESTEQRVTITGANIVTTALPGAAGVLTFNSPWPGMSAYQYTISGVVASSGVAMAGATGKYSYVSRIDAAAFGVGAKPGP